MAKKRHTVSNEHVIWAYEEHIIRKRQEGMSVVEIRLWLREEWSLHVSDNTVRAVLGRRFGT